jgi:HK97 family phage prohead protease
MKKDNIEYRYLDADVAECRILQEGDKKFLEGHASVFNSRSKLIFEDNRLFNEIISPNAFDNVLQEERLDVPMTYNHIRGMLLGRTKSNTLKLSKDEKGLKFRVEVPNTTTGNDVYELVKRGDLYENSFAFITDNASWSKDENGGDLRTINNIKKLVDISVVTNGAYANTDVAARSFEETVKQPEPEVDAEVEKEKVKQELEKMRMHVTLLKLKIN